MTSVPSPPEEAALRVVGLEVRSGGAVVLHDLDLVAAAGSWTSIDGPTGSGKSLLLAALAGLVEGSKGTISLPVHDATPPVALVTQDITLVPYLTAAETVALPMQVAHRAPAEVREQTARWLGVLGVADASRQLVAELSGGERQRVAIAQAMALDTPLLLLDEPTAELDPANRDVVLGLLEERAARGDVVVVVSHEPAVAERAGTRLALAAGRLVPA